MVGYTVEELTQIVKRLQADFENFKKQTEKEKAETIKYANSELISKLFITLDNLKISLNNTEDKEAFVQSMKLIFADLFNFLHNKGLKTINSVGERFDPNKHEVLMVEETDKNEEEGIIIEEFQKGYILYDRVLRPSKVKIKIKKKEVP